jgi:drug/metabolite transporter (DMT)-like permease
LSTAASGTIAAKYKPLSHKQSLRLMFAFTFLGATAQMLMKTGMQQPNPTLWNYITSVPLFVGYSLYGLGAVLFTIALRDGELSVLYPVISLTYVWVAILSVPILHENFNLYTWKGASKIVGIVTIVSGVGVLGRGQKKS